jgi:nucleotide-binding universal stress UspA family protein
MGPKAKSFARRTSAAKITSTVEASSTTGDRARRRRHAPAEVASRIADASREALESALERHKGRGVPIATMLREGVAWEEINRVADEIDADLVVLGTHGRKGLARALLGSTAEKMLRSAHHPVATIHEGSDLRSPRAPHRIRCEMRSRLRAEVHDAALLARRHQGRHQAIVYGAFAR